MKRYGGAHRVKQNGLNQISTDLLQYLLANPDLLENPTNEKIELKEIR